MKKVKLIILAILFIQLVCTAYSNDKSIESSNIKQKLKMSTEFIYSTKLPIFLSFNKTKGTEIITENPSMDFKVFPNPVSDLLKIEIESGLDYQGTFSLMDILGNVRYQNSANVQKGNNILNYPLTNISGGVYYLTFRYSNFKKIICVNVCK